MTDEQLAAIEAREQAAPKGPWRTYPNPVRSDGVFVGQDHPPTFYEGLSDLNGNPRQEAVPRTAWRIHSQLEPPAAEFVAHARQDIPNLLAEVKRLRQELMRSEPIAGGDALVAQALASAIGYGVFNRRVAAPLLPIVRRAIEEARREAAAGAMAIEHREPPPTAGDSTR